MSELKNYFKIDKYAVYSFSGINQHNWKIKGLKSYEIKVERTFHVQIIIQKSNKKTENWKRLITWIFIRKLRPHAPEG